MNTRSLLIVAAAAVVLIALAFVGRERPQTLSRNDTLLLPELEDVFNDVDEIVVTKAGDEKVATLARGTDGWSVAEKDGYPADVGAIRQALLAISEAKIVETKTANPDYYDRLGLTSVDQEDSAGTAVTIRYDDKTLPTIIFGDTEGTNYRYARPADDAQSLLIDRDPKLPRETSGWLRAEILDVQGDRVQQVTIDHADGETVVINKEGRAQTNFSVAPIPEGRELRYPGVANVIGNSLRSLKLEDVRRDEPDVGDVVATAEFKTFDGLVVTATGISIDDADWLRFSAAFDTQQAVKFATEKVDDNLADAAKDDASSDDDGDDGDSAKDNADPRDEADAINARVGGWLYKIADFQYQQMTRRIEDLLKPLEKPDEDSDSQ